MTLGQTIQYAYDANGNRTGMSGPLGEVQYLHDAADRLVTQVDPATGTYRVGYDAAGRRTSLEYPNGVTTEYEYDGASRLLLLLTRNPQGDTLDGYRYTYDPVGNRTSMRSLRDDLLHEYAYDQADRLTRWDRGPDRFEEYQYDAVGNRLELQDERGTVTYSYDQANRLLEELRTLTDGGSTQTTYTWDPNGNLREEAVSTGSVTTYTWNALNRLETLEGPTGTHTYGYDPNGIRVRETDNGETTTFLHAGEDILATYESGALDTYFAHGPGIDEPWARARPGATDNPLAYLHRDGLGSVTGISNQNAQLHGTTTYSAFGEVDDSTGLQTRYGYTSRELDPTDLMYYRARYYQPEVGRFIARDSLDGALSAPLTRHRYGYVHNQPVSLTDPSGHSALNDLSVRSYLIFMGLYGLSVTLVGIGIDLIAHDQAVLRLGLNIFQYALAMTALLVAIEKLGPILARYGMSVGAAILAAIRDVQRSGGVVTNPVTKSALIVVYVAFRIVVTIFKGSASGASIAVTIRNISDFWRTGVIAELMKPPMGGS